MMKANIKPAAMARYLKTVEKIDAILEGRRVFICSSGDTLLGYVLVKDAAEARRAFRSAFPKRKNLLMGGHYPPAISFDMAKRRGMVPGVVAKVDREKIDRAMAATWKMGGKGR